MEMSSAIHQVVVNARDLAVILGVSKSTIHKDLSRAPHRLPPQIVIPGRGVRWLRSDVDAWLLSLRKDKATEKHPSQTPPTQAKRRPGRPRKVSSEGGAA